MIRENTNILDLYDARTEDIEFDEWYNYHYIPSLFQSNKVHRTRQRSNDYYFGTQELPKQENDNPIKVKSITFNNAFTRDGKLYFDMVEDGLGISLQESVSIVFNSRTGEVCVNYPDIYVNNLNFSVFDRELRMYYNFY